MRDTHTYQSALSTYPNLFGPNWTFTTLLSQLLCPSYYFMMKPIISSYLKQKRHSEVMSIYYMEATFRQHFKYPAAILGTIAAPFAITTGKNCSLIYWLIQCLATYTQKLIVDIINKISDIWLFISSFFYRNILMVGADGIEPPTSFRIRIYIHIFEIWCWF